MVAIILSFLSGLVIGEFFSYFPLTLTLIVLLLLFLERIFKKGRLLPFSLFAFFLLGWVVQQVISTSGGRDDLRRYVDRGEIHLVADVSATPKHFPGQVLLEMEGVEIRSEEDLLTGLNRDEAEQEGALHVGERDRAGSGRENAVDWRPVKGTFRLAIYSPDVPYEYGDRLEMVVRLWPFRQFDTPGAFPSTEYRERQGWSGQATLSDLNRVWKVGEGGNPVLRTIYRWRAEIRTKVLASMEGVPAILMLAMIIGETGYLTNSIREAFAASGTTHLLSISGSHLALVSLLIFGAVRALLLRLPSPWLLRLSLRKIPTQWAALATAGPVILYAFLAGGEVATLRSLVMISVYLFAIWIGRETDPKASLSLAALLIVIYHPQAVFDLSFQLSFLSVLSILLAVSRWEEESAASPPERERSFPRPHLRRYLQDYLIDPGQRMFLSGLAATLGTIPLTLYYFHQFSWIGLCANLVLIPLVGGVIVPFGFLSALVSLVIGGNRFPFAAWHEGLWAFYFRLTEGFAGVPGADLHFASPPLWAVFLFYGIFFWLLVKKRPLKEVAVAAIIFLIFFLGVGSIRFPSDHLRVAFLDVGQGDAALIEFPHGKTMLIDGGAGGFSDVGRVAVAPYLWERGIRKIDYLVGTHPQMDHLGGLTYILRKFDIGEVWTNGGRRDLPFYHDFSRALEEKEIRPKIINGTTSQIEVGGCRVLFLSPPERMFLEEEDLNDGSIVLRVVCPNFGKEGFSLLFTGDIERSGERHLLKRGVELTSTVLKVPHHGSAGSLDPEFLSAVSPKAALFSVGRHNRYRHPHPSVLAAYRALQTKIYRTDLDGTVVVEANDEGWSADTDRRNRIEKIRWGSPVSMQEWENIKKVFSRG
ncbi:MAG: DNA internalization-related competence protein ComEC/Rec2 [Candidatus Manganitrophaceae bacterium]